MYDTDTRGLSGLTAKTWFNDGLSGTELAVIGHLGNIAGRDANQAGELVGMPFLESIEDYDMLALRSLHNIMARNADDFADLMSHPTIKDGITDEEAKIVAVLGGRTYSIGLEAVRALLDDSGAYVQERRIELPYTGEALLAVIRARDEITPSMDYFEHTIRTIEEFMGEPFPINYLALLFYGDDQNVGANNNWTHVLYRARADVVDGPDWQNTPGVIAHEVAHWYWRNDGDGYQYQKWISEGSADLLRIISEYERVGRPLTTIGSSCTYFDSISELEQTNPDRYLPSGQVNPPSVCYYSLGQRFFLDLYLALGDEAFRSAYQILYQRTQQDHFDDGCGNPQLNICRLAKAFKDGASAETIRKVDEVIARWYGPLP